MNGRIVKDHELLRQEAKLDLGKERLMLIGLVLNLLNNSEGSLQNC